jgi:hypothetical protein
MKNLIHASCAVLFLGAASVCFGANANEPFFAAATTNDALPPISLTASGSNFFDFLDTVTKAQGEFSQFNNRAYSGAMTFLGVQNAIRFTTNTTGTNVNIALAPINFNRTFTGTSKQAVDDQISDFFKKEGADTIARFLKAIAESSPIAVTDGNPTSATAIAANSFFSSQGFTSSDELADGSDTSSTATKPKFGGISFGLNAGKFEAGVFKGNVYDFSATLLNFGGETVRFMLPVSLNYLKLDTGSEVGGGGISAVLPIRFQKMSRENNWNWRVTPVAGVSVRGSLDLASLSPLWQAGVVNTIDYRALPNLVVSMVNQITMHKSIALAYDDLDFDPQIDQQILKNGLRATMPFNRRVIGDFFVIETNFLKAAAVKNFTTFGGSLAFRVTQKWNIVLGANYDTGSNFKAYSVGLSSAWKW